MLTRLEQWSLALQLTSLSLLAYIGLHPKLEDQFVLASLLLWTGAIAVGVVVDWREYFRQDNPAQWMKLHGLEGLVLFVAPPLMTYHPAWITLLALRQILGTLRLLNRWKLTHKVAGRFLQRPAQLMALSFLVLIALGTFLLLFPTASTKAGSISLLQALFTATSASCVTGLVVLDTPHDFTLFGQLVILALIQIGGLGIMTLSSFILWMMGRRLGVQSRYALGEILDEPTPTQIFGLLRTIIIATLLTELLGAMLLYIRWFHAKAGPLYGLYLSVFHSISAFCNAGFALWSDSLVSFRGDALVNVTIMGLIFAGSLGFPVMMSLIQARRELNVHCYKRRTSRWARLRVYFNRLPLNTKAVLVAQPLLILVAFLAFFFLETNQAMRGLSLGEKWLASLFQSFTLRTAGFNTVDLSHMSQATLLLMITWMFIGGCSGGAAGGVKVNTLVVLLLSLRAMLRGRTEVEAFGRTIPRPTIRRATVIFFSFITLLLLGCMALMVTQPQLPFAHLMFEATSALGTVGLSVNTTSQLNAAGQIIIILLMFVGRIGPLTIALAIGHRPAAGSYQFPRGRIQVG